VIGRSDRALLTAPLVVAAVAAVVVGLADSWAGALLTLAMLLAVGVPAIALVAWAMRRRAALGPLPRQFAVVAAIAAGQLVLTAVLFAILMFLSPHDALLAVVVGVFCGTVGLVAALLLARRVLGDVEHIQTGLEAVGTGRRDVDFATGGRDEIAALAREAERMTDRLAVEERARRELVAAVSHDLRTPITSLRLLVDALEDELVDEADRATYLRRIGVHVHVLSSLVDDLFELTRIETGEIAWSMSRVRLDALVPEAVDALREQAERKGVAMRCSVAGDLDPVEGDAARLQRVLFNLIQNAIRHTPADGSVVVLAERVGPQLEVEVSDSGSGIAAADRDRVFEPFAQGADRADRSDGAGLGLAIARAIVEAHGGRIWLEDADVGTRVRFSLRAA
jgi:signal transduction histidine kinase